MKHKGFTVVELIVVVVVIVILATITVVSYSFLNDDASDSKIRSTMRTVGDAITLHETKNPSRITGEGALTVANGTDSLVPAYLKSGYRNGIGSVGSNYAIIWRSCSATGGFVVYGILKSPTAEDTATTTSNKTTCAHSGTQVPAAYNVSMSF